MKKRYIVFIFIILFITGTILWSRFISTSGLEIHEITVQNQKIPTSFHGTKIIHFSDLHYGRTVNKERFIDIANQINQTNPDIIIFTGDLIEEGIDLSNQDVVDITETLKQMTAKLGKYAIIGNHDFNNTFYKKILEDSNFILLNNTYDIVYNESYEPIFIGGLGSYLYNDAKIDDLLEYAKTSKEELPAYKILLIHEGDIIDDIKEKGFDLILGGHSHNGQIRLPFLGALYNTAGAKHYYEPHYTIDDMEIYISNGIGCSKLSFRLFNKPSINLYRLKNI